MAIGFTFEATYPDGEGICIFGAHILDLPLEADKNKPRRSNEQRGLNGKFLV